jgi:hypothetical protein
VKSEKGAKMNVRSISTILLDQQIFLQFEKMLKHSRM